MTVLTIGNFDGVHLGHRAIVQRARGIADANGERGRVVALTFDRHPASVLRPGSEPPSLLPLAKRIHRLSEAGADEVEPLATDSGMLSQSPEQFIEGLVDRYQPTAIVEGDDFRFGKARAGNMAVMAELGRSRGFEAVTAEPAFVTLDDGTRTVCSSSLTRRLIGRGRVEEAGRCLTQPFELTAEVVRGEQRGRTIETPTANLNPDTVRRFIVPIDGVYAGVATLADDDRAYPAAISIGVKPTFGVRELTVEAHLLGYHPADANELYGQSMTLRFAHWLRDQYPYPNLPSLRDQLARDIEQTRRLIHPAPSTPA